MSEVGIEAAPILAFDAEFAQGDHGFVDGLTLIRHGAIVFDRSYPHDYATAYGGRDATLRPYNYFHPAWHPYYHGTDLHTLQSVTKSVTAVLVGMALVRHEIPTLDVPLLQISGQLTSCIVAGVERHAPKNTRRAAGAKAFCQPGSVPFQTARRRWAFNRSPKCRLAPPERRAADCAAGTDRTR